MTLMEPTTTAMTALRTNAEKLAFLEGYRHGIRETNALWKGALAAGARSDETPTAAQSEASQSGAESATPKRSPNT